MITFFFQVMSIQEGKGNSYRFYRNFQVGVKRLIILLEQN